jgi:hypothetical protein
LVNFLATNFVKFDTMHTLFYLITF